MRLTTAQRTKTVAAVLAAATIGVMAAPAPVAAASSAAFVQPQLPSVLDRHKAIAADVLKRLFEHGDASVVDRYIRPDYIQHNPLAPNGTAALKAFAVPLAKQFPGMKYDIRSLNWMFISFHHCGELVGDPMIADGKLSCTQ